MRTLLLTVLLSTTALAGPLGGPNLDSELAFEWKTRIADQKFPMLPHASKMPKIVASSDTLKMRQRYIMYIGTAHLNPDMQEGFSEGYYQMHYASKVQGNFLLEIHSKYKECFENARKKFDEMQLVVFSNGSYPTPNGQGMEGVIVEKVRQCRGDYPESGGKLKKKAK